ncbi:calcium-binding protein [Vibrio sp. Evd11]|uniref:calcium-binding protein n=1 Tax=Vibrio sp. Evd11 TaxID=1207404 RepID=UPI0013C46263|nr:calcium-binding protein [Vibrio sp. Evd11]
MCHKFGEFASSTFHSSDVTEDKYVPRPDIWHGPEEWRGKAQQEKAWDQDYNKNGEYEAEQNIRNGSYTPDRNGSDRRKKYKEFWSKPENKKRAEEDGANDLNGPEALNRPAVKQNPTVTNNSKSGSDRNRDRNSGSGSSRDRYRDSRNSNDSGRFGPPIILDLDGDGVELTALDESSTFYDISGDGYRNKIGWADKDDGILAFDKNSDGFIQDRDEIAFVDYKEGAETDLEGLTAFDSNNDGVLDNKDKQWNQFGVWQDHDQDGISDEGEFKSLDEMGITSIDLSSDGEEHDNNGNIVYGLGSYTRSDGSTHTFADTGLQYSDFSYRANDDNSIDIKTDGMGIKVLADDSDNTFTVSEGEFEMVLGGTGSDTITVDTKQGIVLDGGKGDDHLIGGDGNDWLIGGKGADRLEGGAGSDILFIDRLDLGRGEIDGGEGFDIAVVEGNEAIEINASQHDLEAVYSSSGNDKLTSSGDVGVMLYGGDGDDIISGSSGADLLQGDAGADIINGGEGDDYLIVDELDTWHGGDGYDTAIFNSTHDLNIDLRQHSVERFIAGGGNDTIISGETNNIIASGAGDDTIDSGAGADTILAGKGDDQIKAGDGADFLSGGQGNDDLQGGDGDDTYFFARGDGQDSILDQSIQNVTETYTQTVKRRPSFGKFSLYVNEKRTRTRTVAKEVDGGDDTLQMGATISMGDLFATTQPDRLTIRLNESSGSDQLSEDAVTVRNWSDSKNRIEFIELETGEVFDISKVGLAVSGSEGNDVISLASGQPSSPNKKDAVWFNGGGGNDVITGGSLADFLFGGNGQDTLHGNDGDDYIAGNSGDDQIYAGSGNDDLFGGIGDDRIDAGSGNDYLHGEAGDDLLIGSSGNDVLVGGVGSDRLEGGQGNDTYIFNRGDGRDQILDKYIGQVTTAYTYTKRVHKPSGKSGRWVNERRTGYRKSMSELDGGSDTLQFGAGISVSDILVQHSGTNLFVGLKDDGITSASEALDRVEVLEWADKKNRVETFRFSDGLSIDMSDVRYAWTGGDSDDKFEGTHEGDWLSGNAGNDHLFGQFGNDVLIGGSGDDLLEGGAGNDTYIVNRGDGKDTIYDDHRVTETQRYTYYERVLKQGFKSSYYVNEKRTGTKTVTKQNDAGEDILLFGKDISFEDIVLQSSGSHLLVGLGHSDQNENISELEDVVTIKDWSNKNNRIELFQFEDGTDVDMSLIQSASTGTSEGETLNGDNNGNWLDGSGGNDIINAGSGNDIIWGGFGSDKLIGGSGNDQLYGQDGNDVLTDASGNNLFMAGTGDDTLTGGNGVDILLGEAGSDTINGGQSDDHLLGGAGNDILIGGEGNDTYYFSYGDGQDVVRNSDSAGKDTLTFDGISSENVWFERRENHLVANLLGTSDEIKFESWFTNASARIDTFTDTSGATLAYSQVNKLIEVMSGYQANDGASFEGVLPNSLPYEVQIAVDSAWRPA